MNTQFHNKGKKRKEKRFRFLDFRVFFAIFGALILSSQLIFAQGITIPSGSTINVNTGTLDVGGSVTNAGTLLLTSGAVELQGDWTNSGTFTAGSGTVQFDATTGTQNLTSGGTGVGNLFYNLSHTDAGTVEVLANDLDINNNFTNSSGAFDTNGNDMTVAGAWNNSSTFTHGSNSVTLDGTDQTILGSTTFYNFTKNATTPQTLTFDDTGTQTIENSLIMTGTDAVNRLTITSDNPGTQAAITLSPGATQDLNFLTVGYSNAGGGLTLIARNSTESPGSTTTNWVFGAATVTWTGVTDSDWDDPTNWDIGLVPVAGDTAIIPDVSPNSFPAKTSASGAVSVANLTVSSGATLTLNENDFTVSTAMSNDGTIIFYGTQSISIASGDADSGTIQFTGDGDGSAENFNLPNLTYYNLTINDTDASSDTFQTTADLTINGSLTITDGELDIATNDNNLDVAGNIVVNGGLLTTAVIGNSGDVDIEGDLTISSGTFVAPDSTATFTLAGDFTHSGTGILTHSSGTLVMDGTTGQSILGDADTSFNSLTKTVASTQTLTFSTSSIQSFASTLTLQGADASNRLFIDSDTAGVQACIELLSGITQTLEFLSVRDSDASGTCAGGSGAGAVVTAVARNSVENPGSTTTNWVFGATTLTWQGDDGGSPTDWDTAQNWDLGVVPIAGDSVIIPLVATSYPILSSDVDIEDLSLTNAAATLTLNGNGLEVDDTLSNLGNIRLIGSETVTISVVDTDSGTFTYLGDADAGADPGFTIIDLDGDAGDTDYYNLVISDGDNLDTFSTAGEINVANNLTITGGIMDISAGTDDLNVGGTLLVNGGTLTATNGNIDADGAVNINAGTLTAPGSSNTFTVGGNWTLNGAATFADSTGTVTFDTSANTSTFTGDTTFNNLTSTTAGKSLIFTAGSTQTVNDTLTLTGVDGNRVSLTSTVGGTKWDIDFPNGSQNVLFVSVQDSDANTNTVTCFNCTDGGNNNANWIFDTLSIDVPQDGKTVGTTPTIIGRGPSGITLDVLDSGNNLLTQVVPNANGDFRVELTSPLGVGADSLKLSFSGTTSAVTNITVDAAPDPEEQPTITSFDDGDRVLGANPTITGRGAPGATVTVIAQDSNGEMAQQVVATGTVGADDGSGSGIYSFAVSTDLFKGTNYISVTVDGVASDIVEPLFVDPWGVVFDSIENFPINEAVVTIYRSADDELAVPGVDLDAGDVNPYTTGPDGLYSFFTINADYYMTVNAAGYDFPSVQTTFPAGRQVITGSKGEAFTVNNVILNIDIPLDANGQLLRVEKTANKSEVSIGDVVTYTVKIQNFSSDNDIQDVYLEDKLAPGFKYLPNRVTLDDVPIADPTGNRPLTFTIGTVSEGQERILRYQTVVGAGVIPGEYDNVAFAKFSNGQILSNTSRATVEVVLDPLFDLGTIIGKVFFDRNANGLQDAPEYSPLDRKELQEPPIPNVQLMMEDGTVITTDQDGKFHIPGVRPGRHVLRLDERSLPEGSYLTTDKAVILNITPGLLTKVNFGVDLDYESYATEDNIYFNEEIKFVHDRTTPKPRLNVSTYEEPVMVYNDVFVDTVEFRIFTNYAAFVNKWKLDIVDKDTKRLARSFEGDQLNIFDPIYWKGLDSTGNHIDLDKRYEYFVTIEDAKGNYDETTPKEIVFEEIADDEALDKYYENTKQIRLTEYPKWVKEENQKNNLGIQTILIDGETIQIDQKESPVRNVRIMQDGRVINDIPVMEKQGLTAKELLLKEKQKTTDASPIDIILPKGDFEVVVQEREVDEAAPVPVLIDEPAEGVVSAGFDVPLDTKTYSKKVRVGEDYLFFVALGDAEIGYSFTEGNIEPVEHDDRFNGGYYSDGKLAYYLKGKIKGKYLVTSSFDSERDNKEIFKKIDEDTYYPVYGDESSVNYADTNTQGKLYLKLEWDKSEVLWGNYSIAFGDTEFAQFSRSLFGGKVDFESVSTTEYGEPRTKIVAFRAEAKQKSAHVEMLATGGSLYFMKHKDILQGSDKVRVEVRDKITGLVISSREMKEGSDYEMDYGSGRMLFWKPIPILVDAYSIISSELLDGNLVYVVADYEYEVEDKIDEANAGFRARQAFGDDVLVGATYVKESLATSDYTLRGTDITLHAGKDATVVAEYAESEAEVTGSFVSTDGGITYTEIETDEGSEGRAYGIKGDARLFNNLAIKTYYKWVENDFSSSASLTQKGKETIGLEAIYDLSEDTRVTFRHDIQSLIEDGSGVTQLQLGAYKTSTSLLQVVHQARRLKITGEYQRKVVEKRLDQFDNTEISDEDVLAVQADYDLVSDKLAVTLRQQVSVGDEQERQTTIGVTATPTESLKITATETLADSGTATRLGVEASVTEKLTLLGEYGIVTDAETGKVGSVASVGGKAKVSDVLELEGSVGMASDVPGLSVDRATTLALGGTTKVSENTEVTTQFEVSDSNSGQKTKVAVGGASQVDDDTKVSTQLSMAGDGLGVDTRTMTITGDQRVDDTTRIQNSLSVTDSATGVKTTNFSFGTTKKINEEIELASVRTFGTSPDENKTGSKYSIIREKDGKKLEGSLTRSYLESDSAVTRSNIFGLSGEIDDRWALSGSYEKGEVQNLDGETTLRDALSIGVGYVKKDPEKGKVLESSTKLELRVDEGTEDKKQFLIFNTIEGKLTPELTLSTKFEYSKTLNSTTDITEAEHKEIMFGAAYRPIMHDNLNLFARYTYLDNYSPAGQIDSASLEQEAAQVWSFESVYDLDEKWQLSEKFAYRIGKEKSPGFDFNKTRTWLMIHRVNYKVDKDWAIGAEFRSLTQEEAKDTKRGVLLEATRRVGEYAQLGVGYNFTDFSDDLTSLDYTVHGPFIRLTGSLYDQTPEEIERNRRRWLEEKITRWAWAMVRDELSRHDSPMLDELNEYFILAQKAYEAGEYEEAHKLYKDIISGGQMMFQEAAEYIRGRISREQKLEELNALADQYFKNGQYEKAKKILEKIVDEAQKTMLEWEQ